MNIFDAISNDNPYSFYKIANSATSYTNLTGRTNPATATTALPISSTYIVSGNTSSGLIGGTGILKMPYNRFAPGTETNPFTLECWFYPVVNTAVGIMSHTGDNDGLYFDGDIISFGVDFKTLGSLRANWVVPDFKSAYHLVGVYSANKITLYVNGEMVSAVDVGNEYVVDGFATLADTALYAGAGTGAVALFDAPATYNYGLTNVEVEYHYNMGRASIRAYDIATNRGGYLWTFTDDDRNVLYRDTLPFDQGSFDGTVSRDGLRPAVNDDLTSMTGTWLSSLYLGDTGDTSLAGIKLTWNGDGNYIVETSVNEGVTWTAVTNGSLAAGTVGMDTTLIGLDVRITFPGGIVDDISVVRDISAVAYADGIVRGGDMSRALSVTGSVTTADRFAEPLERYDATGIKTNGNATGTLSTDTTTEGGLTPVNSVEFWVNFNSFSGNSYLFDFRTASATSLPYLYYTAGKLSFSGITLYVNGTARTSATFSPTAGQWYHIIAVATTPGQFDGPMTLFSRYTNAEYLNAAVGLMAMYPSAISSSDALAIYNSYNSVPKLTVTDSNAIVATEAANSYLLYDYDWSISASG